MATRTITPRTNGSPRHPGASTDVRPRPLRIVIAHDEPMLGRSLEAVLRGPQEPSVDVVATVTEDGLVAAIEQHTPDAVVLASPGRSDSGRVARLRQHFPDLAIVCLGAQDDGVAGARGLAEGASAMATTDGSPARLRSLLAAVSDGWVVLPPDQLGDLRQAAEARLRLARLDDEQRELLEMIVDGSTGSEIAQRLYVSERTVKRRVASLLEDLGCADRLDAARLYGAAFPSPRGS